MKNLKSLIVTLFIISTFIISGCVSNSNSTDDIGENQNTSDNIITSSDHEKVNLPESFSYIVPYDDILNDGGELGWYRPTDNGDFSMELTKNSHCTDSEVIGQVYALINLDYLKTDRFIAEGHIDPSGLSEIAQSVNDYPPISMEFDKLYQVMIYPNDVIVTNTFYTEGEIYDELAGAYFEEHGTMPPAVTDGFNKFISKENTFKTIYEILINLPEEN